MPCLCGREIGTPKVMTTWKDEREYLRVRMKLPPGELVGFSSSWEGE
jgi:hypothetical protein